MKLRMGIGVDRMRGGAGGPAPVQNLTRITFNPSGVIQHIPAAPAAPTFNASGVITTAMADTFVKNEATGVISKVTLLEGDDLDTVLLAGGYALEGEAVTVYAASPASAERTLALDVAVPVFTTDPTLDGTPVEGFTATSSTGVLTGTQPMTFTFQWYRGASTAITGATGQTYTFQAADVGSTVFCRVTATNSQGSDTADTAPTATVAAATSAPSITSAATLLVAGAAAAQVGNTLNITGAVASGKPTPTYTHALQKSADGSTNWFTIATTTGSGTTSSYTLLSTDATYHFRLVSTATNGVAPDATSTTATIGPVAAQPAGSDVASLAALTAALTGTAGGYEVVLANGDYSASGTYTVSNKRFTNPVTIRPQTPGGATIKRIVMSNCANIVWDGVHIVTNEDTINQHGLSLESGCNDIVFKNANITGKSPMTAASLADDFAGVNASGGTNRFTIENCTIKYFGFMTKLAFVANTTFRNILLDRIGKDVVRLQSEHNQIGANDQSLFEDIRFVDGGYFVSNPGTTGTATDSEHTDWMQGFGAAGTGVGYKNVTFRRCLAILAEKHYPEHWQAMKGIQAGPPGPWSGIVYEDCIFMGGGSALALGVGMTARRCTFVSHPQVGGGFKIDLGANIINCIDVVETSGEGLLAGGQLLRLHLTDAASPYHILKYFPNLTQTNRPWTLSDFAPQSGSLAESMGAIDYWRTLTSSAPPSNPTTAPVITGPSGAAGATSVSATVNENTTRVGTWTANQTVTWSLSGADAAKFSISTGGVLDFVAAPNYENPTDTDANNVYLVNVLATNGASLASSQAVAVTVADVTETSGTASIVSQANVLTSSVATSADQTSTSTFTCTGEASRILLGIVQFTQGAGFTASTMTLTAGGVAMTRVEESIHASGAGFPGLAVYRLNNPTAGAKSIVVGGGNAVQATTVHMIEVTGADMTTPIGAVAEALSGAGPTVSIAHTPQKVGSLLLGIITHDATINLSAASGTQISAVKSGGEGAGGSSNHTGWISWQTSTALSAVTHQVTQSSAQETVRCALEVRSA